MKILAPARSAEEVTALVPAGADEFYCGLQPPGWERRFGGSWAHRRPHASAGVADPAALPGLVAAAAGRPVFVALNSPAYPAGAVEVLAAFGRELVDQGAAALIVADLELLLALADRGLAGRVHVSSLATVTNPGAARFFRSLGVSRVIFPRHLTPGELGAGVVAGLEFEAFLLNDGCVFEEGLCATTHAAGPFCRADGDGATWATPAARDRYAFWKWTLDNCGCRESRGYPLGPCGLCAIPALLAAGIDSFKVVGREASLGRKVASVRLARAARDLAVAGAAPAVIRERVIRLRGGRSLCEGRHACYYPAVWDGVAGGQERGADAG